MNQLIIGIAVVLILAILVLMFRIQTLLNVMRGSYRQIGGLSNRINALLLPLFGIIGFSMFFWYSGKASAHYLPESASIHGVETDFMFWLTIGILVVAFLVTHIFLLGFAFRYQYKDGNKAYYYPENHRLEFVWTIIPAIVMAILVYYGWKTWSDITKKEPDNSVAVEIVGQQFNWSVRYPGADNKLGNYHYKQISPDNPFGLVASDKASWDDFMPKEIHIPKGQPVLLKIRAKDVLHSVYLPHFRVKMDAVPGMPTKFWFVATKSTNDMRQELSNPKFNYELACAEICGRGHFSMKYILVVDEPAEYKQWVESQTPWIKSNREFILANIPDAMKDEVPAEPVAPSTTPEKTNAPAPADTTAKSNGQTALK